MAPEAPHPALPLLALTHGSQTATQILTDQIRHRPLLLRPSSPDPTTPANSRAARRAARQKRDRDTRRAEKKRRKTGRSSLTERPKPLSAKEKRALGVYELGESERKWEIFVGLHRLWCGYVREVLGVGAEGTDGDAVGDKKEGQNQEGVRENKGKKNGKAGGKAGISGSGGQRGGSGPRLLSPDMVGPLLASADYHGALLEVVRSGCVSRVGLKGIVVKDTKFTFEMITKKNELKTVPKEGTVFRFELPLEGSCVDDLSHEAKRLVFEIYGEHLMTSAPDRANKKFKQHFTPGV